MASGAAHGARFCVGQGRDGGSLSVGQWHMARLGLADRFGPGVCAVGAHRVVVVIAGQSLGEHECFNRVIFMTKRTGAFDWSLIHV